MKKRSLLAATAMLLVAVLAATGATYAWFQESKVASATVEMSVASASTLEISLDKVTWVSVLDADDLFEGNAHTWSDFSTTNGKDFFTETYETGTTTLNGYEAGTVAMNDVIYFRSTSEDAIKFGVSSKLEHIVDGTSKAAIPAALRFSVQDVNGANTKIYSTTGATIKGVTEAGDGVTTANIDTLHRADQASNVVGGAANVVTLKAPDAADGYYYGEATFTFWIEGTMANANNAGGTAKATLIFEQ